MKKINEQYIKELAKDFNKSIDYVRSVVTDNPNPRKHFAILEDEIPYTRVDKKLKTKFRPDATEIKRGKYKGWTIDMIVKESEKFDSLNDFSKAHQGLLHFMFITQKKHLLKCDREKVRYNEDTILQEAKELSLKYDTFSEFRKSNYHLYQALVQRKITNLVSSYYNEKKGFLKGTRVWTKKKVYELADKCKDWNEFKSINRSLVHAVSTNGMTKEIKERIILNKYKND